LRESLGDHPPTLPAGQILAVRDALGRIPRYAEAYFRDGGDAARARLNRATFELRERFPGLT